MSSSSTSVIKGKTICFTGALESQTRDEASKAAVSVGARVAKTVSKNVDIVVCADGAGLKKKQAQEKGCTIWTEAQFLAAVGYKAKAKTSPKKSPKKTSSAPSTPAKQPPKKKTKIEPATPALPGSSKRKVMSAIKDGDQYSVHGDYDVKLMLSDQTNMNSNKFYKLQLLCRDGAFFVATHWGRLGEPGRSQLKGPHATEEKGITEFGKVFRSKTRNDWGADPFMRYGDKYQLVETTVDDDGNDDNMDDGTALGRLTESQIHKGQAVLKDIRNLLEAKETTTSSGRRKRKTRQDEDAIGNLSNDFYSLIPTKSGRQRPPLLDNLDIITEKEGLLEFWLRMGFEQVSPQNVDGSPIQGVHDLPVPPTLTAAASNIADIGSIASSQSRGQELATASTGNPVKTMNAELYAAILLYTGNSIYHDLNRCLRVEWDGAKKYWNYLRLYFEAMNCMPKKEVTLWRGIAADLFDEYKPGKIIKWWTVSSCTSSKQVAENFMNQLGSKATLLTLKTKTACDISSLSFYPNEQESLLSPGVKLRVISRKRNGSVAEIEVEEVLEDDEEDDDGDKKPAAKEDDGETKLSTIQEEMEAEDDEKPAAEKDTRVDDKVEEDETMEEGDDESGPALDGMIFSITGSLSMKRSDFEALLEEHGGVVKGSVTKDVTHLISARDDTAKAQKAKAKGVKILKEEDVMTLVGK